MPERASKTDSRMRTIVPPIKSQGIKTKLAPWIRALVPDVKGRWIEPFLGTGVVAFNSGFERAVLADVNPHIIDFYRRIQEGTISPFQVRAYLEEEGELLRKAAQGGYEHYGCVRDRFNRDHGSLDFLFLSRAGFNGMMRFNRKGEWNIPFCKKQDRFNKAYVTKIVNQVQDVANQIRPGWRFLAASFEETIGMATADDIIYCDPPYRGRHVDYHSGWGDEDEKLLFELLSSTEAKFILSTWHHNDYRDNAMIERHWSRFNIVTRDHFYHAGARVHNRNSIVEALVFNFEAEVAEHNHGVEAKHEPRDLFGAGADRAGQRLTPAGSGMA